MSDSPLPPHQWRKADGSIVETADFSAWLIDPFDHQRVTYGRLRFLAKRLKEQHGVTLSRAYEILVHALGHVNYGDLVIMLDQQMPGIDAMQRRQALVEGAYQPNVPTFEMQRRAANMLHDEVHGPADQQIAGKQVTRTGHISDDPTAVPINGAAVQAVYYAGPETKKLAKREG